MLHPPLLYALGRGFAVRAPESAQGGGARVFGTVVVVSCLAVDVLNALGEDSKPSPALGAVVASYPAAFWLGWDAGRRRRSL
jgi:hypothetical protein